MAQLLQQLTGDADNLVDGFYHVYGDTDGTSLVCDSAGDGLTDPPSCVGGELKALVVVKLFNGLDQTQIAFLNQIQEQQAAAYIALCNGNYQTQVCFCHAALCFFAAFSHFHGQLHFFFGSQQGDLADFLRRNEAGHGNG